MNCKCGGTYQYFNSLEEIVFPIGMMKINHDGWKCNKCHKIKFDKELCETRKREYRKIIDNLLRKYYPFNKNEWVDLHEFASMIDYDEQFINDNIDFFTTMVFSIKQYDKYWFLKKSILQYMSTDDGRFKLSNYDIDNKLMHIGCPVCGVGDINEKGICTCCGSGKRN